MAELAEGCEALEDWERDESWKLAPFLRVIIRRRKDPQAHLKPPTRAMRGEELYIRINRVLQVRGYELRPLPPPPAKFGATQIKPALKIAFMKGRLSIKLALRGTPTNDMMVFGSPPRRAEQRPGGGYAFLGLLPPPKGGECEILGTYEEKLRGWLKLSTPQDHAPLPVLGLLAKASGKRLATGFGPAIDWTPSGRTTR